MIDIRKSCGMYTVVDADNNRFRQGLTKGQAQDLKREWSKKAKDEEGCEVVDLGDETKSDRVRNMIIDGKSVLEIKKETGWRYQFIHNVYTKWVKIHGEPVRDRAQPDAGTEPEE